MGQRCRTPDREIGLPYPPRIAESLELLALLPARDDRIQALISLAKRFQSVPDEIAVRPFDESHRVPGCESEAFVWVLLEAGRLRIEFAVENPQGVSAQALAVLLKEGLDSEEPVVAKGLDDDIVFLMFGRELSMGKSLGLTNMVRAVRARALSLVP